MAASVRSSRRTVSECSEGNDRDLLQEIGLLEAIYIHELNINQNESGIPTDLNINLHPATADNVDQQYVCLTLNITIPAQYPHSLPDITICKSRGVSDEHLISLESKLKDLATERQGEPMLYELIEVAKESLTNNNTPSCECAICLEGFTETDVFTRTLCYHYFHCYCLARYLQHAADNEQQSVCAICREPVTYDLSQLRDSPAPSADRSSYTPDKVELIAQQRRMTALYRRQKERGGIIDLEEESTKFLIDISQTPSVPVNVGVLPSRTSVAEERRSMLRDELRSGARQLEDERRNRTSPQEFTKDENILPQPRSNRGRYNRQRGRGRRYASHLDSQNRCPKSSEGDRRVDSRGHPNGLSRRDVSVRGNPRLKPETLDEKEDGASNVNEIVTADTQAKRSSSEDMSPPLKGSTALPQDGIGEKTALVCQKKSCEMKNIQAEEKGTREWERDRSINGQLNVNRATKSKSIRSEVLPDESFRKLKYQSRRHDSKVTSEKRDDSKPLKSEQRHPTKYNRDYSKPMTDKRDKPKPMVDKEEPVLDSLDYYKPIKYKRDYSKTAMDKRDYTNSVGDRKDNPKSMLDTQDYSKDKSDYLGCTNDKRTDSISKTAKGPMKNKRDDFKPITDTVNNTETTKDQGCSQKETKIASHSNPKRKQKLHEAETISVGSTDALDKETVQHTGKENDQQTCATSGKNLPKQRGRGRGRQGQSYDFNQSASQPKDFVQSTRQSKHLSERGSQSEDRNQSSDRSGDRNPNVRQSKESKDPIQSASQSKDMNQSVSQSKDLIQSVSQSKVRLPKGSSLGNRRGEERKGNDGTFRQTQDLSKVSPGFDIVGIQQKDSSSKVVKPPPGFENLKL